ncbi:MAG: alkaline phosphatase family protein [Spirochaetales bacterium]|nr:alkaline phosphatase family protein [Spirochaetales bacterium]
MDTHFFKKLYVGFIILSFFSCVGEKRDFNTDILSNVESENRWDSALPQTAVHDHVIAHFSEKNGKVKKALIIGLDGTRPDAAVQAGMIGKISNIVPGMKFYYSYAGGDWKNGTQQPTITAPGWTTIMTGVWANQHGISTNDSGNKNPATKTFCQKVYDMDNNREVAVIAAWENITELGTYGDENVYTYTPDDGYYKKPEDYDTKDPRVVEKTIELIEDDYACIFNVIDFTDHTGHLNQFSPFNTTYVDEIERALGMAEEMINAAKGRSKFADEDWLFIITTDHGGVGMGHGGQSLPERTTFIYTNKTIN